ncbi:unnamed protein product, partial [Chrysoparadoxa australica]
PRASLYSLQWLWLFGAPRTPRCTMISLSCRSRPLAVGLSVLRRKRGRGRMHASSAASAETGEVRKFSERTRQLVDLGRFAQSSNPLVTAVQAINRQLKMHSKLDARLHDRQVILPTLYALLNQLPLYLAPYQRSYLDCNDEAQPIWRNLFDSCCAALAATTDAWQGDHESTLALLEQAFSVHESLSRVAWPKGFLDTKRVAKLRKLEAALIELRDLLTASREHQEKQRVREGHSLGPELGDSKIELELLCQELLAVAAVPAHRERQVEDLRLHIQRTLRRCWGDATLHVFGSSAGDLVTLGSDIDFSLEVPSIAEKESKLAYEVRRMQSELEACIANYSLAYAVKELEDSLEAEKKALTASVRLARANLSQLENERHKASESMDKLFVEGVPSEEVRAAASEKVRRCESKVLLARRKVTMTVDDNAESLANLEQRSASLAAAMPDDIREQLKELKRLEQAVKTAKARLVKEKANNIYRVQGFLKRDFSEIGCVPKARVPLVTLKAKGEGWEQAVPCDICINNTSALHNTRLLLEYGNISCHFTKLTCLVKTWARARGINTANSGTLSSYSFAIMVVHYLQHLGHLPHLQDPELKVQLPQRWCEGLDITFLQAQGHTSGDKQHGKRGGRGKARGRGGRGGRRRGAAFNHPKPPPPPAAAVAVPSSNATTSLEVHHLFRGFIWYFRNTFDLMNDVVCVGRGPTERILKKAEIWASARPWRISIEDPFKKHESLLPHDLGTVVSPAGQMRINRELARAEELMEKGGVKNWKKIFEKA